MDFWMLLKFYFLLLRDRVSYLPGWPSVSSVAEDGLEFSTLLSPGTTELHCLKHSNHWYLNSISSVVSSIINLWYLCSIIKWDVSDSSTCELSVVALKSKTTWLQFHPERLIQSVQWVIQSGRWEKSQRRPALTILTRWHPIVVSVLYQKLGLNGKALAIWKHTLVTFSEITHHKLGDSRLLCYVQWRFSAVVFLK